MSNIPSVCLPLLPLYNVYEDFVITSVWHALQKQPTNYDNNNKFIIITIIIIIGFGHIFVKIPVIT